MEKPIGWFWGIIFPLLIAAMAIHDMLNQSVSIQQWIEDLDILPDVPESAIFSGAPSVLFSSSFLLMALALHAMFWSGRGEGLQRPARMLARLLGILSVAAFIGGIYWNFHQ